MNVLTRLFIIAPLYTRMGPFSSKSGRLQVNNVAVNSSCLHNQMIDLMTISDSELSGAGILCLTLIH